jgi:hypothetical protein
MSRQPSGWRIISIRRGSDTRCFWQARQDFRVSVLIKKKNFRKHNSHQWFMAAFARELEATYILCTDCSTVFEKSMCVVTPIGSFVYSTVYLATDLV